MHSLTDCYYTIPSANQPSSDDVKSGFALSAFLKVVKATNGYITAKTNSANDIQYGLSVRATDSQTVFEFRYAIPQSSVSSYPQSFPSIIFCFQKVILFFMITYIQYLLLKTNIFEKD